MNPKIKQKIEKESFIIYPIDLKGTGLDWNKALRDEWVKGAEYGYNIKESVNEKLLRQVQRLTTWFRMEGNDDDIKIILEAEEVMNKAEAKLSASNQENNEGDKCEHKHIIYINEYLGYLCTECRKFNIKRN